MSRPIRVNVILLENGRVFREEKLDDLNGWISEFEREWEKLFVRLRSNKQRLVRGGEFFFL